MRGLIESENQNQVPNGTSKSGTMCIRLDATILDGQTGVETGAWNSSSSSRNEYY